MVNLMMLLVLSVSVLASAESSVVQKSRESRSLSHPARVKREDDVSVTSLKVMVEQQASLIHTLQSDLAATKNQVNMNNNGLAAIDTRMHTLESKSSKSVAFTVRFRHAHDASGNGVPLGAHQTLVFDDVVTNIGQAYSSTTGIFTAPTAGTYVLFLSQMASTLHNDVVLDIVKNGAVLDQVYAQGSADASGNDQGSSQVNTRLAQGDQLWVRQYSGDHVRGSYWTIFTGFLIHADA